MYFIASFLREFNKALVEYYSGKEKEGNSLITHKKS
jgi:hypothetical protein